MDCFSLYAGYDITAQDSKEFEVELEQQVLR